MCERGLRGAPERRLRLREEVLRFPEGDQVAEVCAVSTAHPEEFWASAAVLAAGGDGFDEAAAFEAADGVADGVVVKGRAVGRPCMALAAGTVEAMPSLPAPTRRYSSVCPRYFDLAAADALGAARDDVLAQARGAVDDEGRFGWRRLWEPGPGLGVPPGRGGAPPRTDRKEVRLPPRPCWQRFREDWRMQR